jgi:cation diffusion facilitator CzcD-associated flavoprotein CzcO
LTKQKRRASCTEERDELENSALVFERLGLGPACRQGAPGTARGGWEKANQDRDWNFNISRRGRRQLGRRSAKRGLAVVARRVGGVAGVSQITTCEDFVTMAKGTSGALNFDPDELKRRYAAERDKRVRPDGLAQYVEIGGAFAHFVDDPFVDEPLIRRPLVEDVDVLIIGGGMCGVLTASRLRQAGVDNIRIIEKAGDFGGNWYWNRYPGAACDTESYIYMPLLEETGYVPREKYAKAPEIHEQFQRIAKQYDLYRAACFQTAVTDLEWDEAPDRWIVKTDRVDVFRARFLCLCLGGQTRPKLPGIPGIDGFKGHSFHTSRWDYKYTGGDSYGNLVKLQDKRVAIIGTGATAIQAIPHLGAWCEHLLVFQRTPSTVDVRANRPTDPQWAASLQPGWQRSRVLNFESITLGLPQDEDLVGDGWTDNARRLRTLAGLEGGGRGSLSLEERQQLADFEKMELLRQRIDDVVQDPETARALKPYYNLYCKRPCFHDEYLSSFNRPNVTLVDTDGRGVDRLTATGVVVGEREYEVDCVIYSTGFEVLAMPYRVGQFVVRGVGGQSLEDKWRSGIMSLHGMSTHDFPNMLVIGNLRDGGASSNAHYAYNGQCIHAAEVISHCLATGVTRAETTQAAEEGWARTMREKAPPLDRFWLECTPGYLNSEGRAGADSFRLALYGGGSIEYFDILDDWRRNRLERDMDLVRS